MVVAPLVQSVGGVQTVVVTASQGGLWTQGAGGEAIVVTAATPQATARSGGGAFGGRETFYVGLVIAVGNTFV